MSDDHLESIVNVLMAIEGQLAQLCNLVGHPDHVDTLSGGVAAVAGYLEQIAESLETADDS